MLTPVQAIQRVAGRLGQPQPPSILGSAEATVVQWRELLEEGCAAIAARGQWNELTKEQTFLTVATESQGLLTAICTEYPRYILPYTLWDRTNKIRLTGALDPQDWASLKAWQINGPLYQFRLREGKLLVNPVPTAGYTWAFEYVTENWGETAGGQGIRRLGADTDLIRLPENIILADLKWRWKEVKGFPYAQDFENAEALIVDALARSKQPGKVLDQTNFREDAGPRITVSPGSLPL